MSGSIRITQRSIVGKRCMIEALSVADLHRQILETRFSSLPWQFLGNLSNNRLVSPLPLGVGTTIQENFGSGPDM